MARGKKTTNEKPIEAKEIKEEIKEIPKENTQIQATYKVVIIIGNDVKLRKYPNLNTSDIIGIANIGARYKIISEVNTDKGKFYQLSNGGYYVDALNSNIRVQ